MRKMSALLVNSLAGLLAATALFNVGVTSIFLYHEPDMPSELRK